MTIIIILGIVFGVFSLFIFGYWRYWIGYSKGFADGHKQGRLSAQWLKDDGK